MVMAVMVVVRCVTFILCTGKPDPPYGLNVVNVSHDSITVSWEAGFDGGLEQFYRVRYKPTQTVGYMYVDVPRAAAASFTLMGETTCCLRRQQHRAFFFICMCFCSHGRDWALFWICVNVFWENICIGPFFGSMWVIL